MKSLTFVFDDESWPRKFFGMALCLLAGFIPLIGVLGSCVSLGYSKRLFRNVVAGQEKPLPEWDDLGGDMLEGFKAFVIMMVYMLPLLMLYLVIVLSAVFMQGLFTTTGEEGPQVAFALLGMGCSVLLVFAVVLLTMVYLQIGIMRFFATESMGSAFDVMASTRTLLRRPWAFIKALLFVLMVAILAQLGVLACGVGLLFTLPWSILVVYKVWGDYWRETEGELVTHQTTS
jgi:hypothetical protein